MAIRVCCLLALCMCHTFDFQVSGHTIAPVITQTIKVQSVPFPVVVVKGDVAILHVAVFGFFPQVFVFIIWLGLLFVTTLILDNVLPRKRKKKKQHIICTGTVFKVEIRGWMEILKWCFIRCLAGIWQPFARWAQPRRSAEPAAHTSTHWRSSTQRRVGRGSGGTPTSCEWSWKKDKESSHKSPVGPAAHNVLSQSNSKNTHPLS